MVQTLDSSLIRGSTLFQGFNDEEAAQVRRVAREKTVAKGGMVFVEGSHADAMYIVQDGTVEIMREGQAGARLVVAELGPGALFGEMAFVDRSPRSTSAGAKDELDLLEIRFEELGALARKNPVLGMKLYQSIAATLCARIRRTTSELSSLLLS